jgi:dTDP-4-amino-4,6-dideoxygalactose transaminase
MKNNIEFVNLKRQYKRYKNEIDDAISEVISKNAFISGVFSKKFENNFKNMLGVDEFIATGNGTDSLYIIMKSLGIGFGDEVITTCNSWISSSETISQCGANPVFIDIDKFNTIDPEKISQKITKNTKALLIVHIHGQSCEMDSILKTCEENNILLIEDCAQSHFSSFRVQIDNN